MTELTLFWILWWIEVTLCSVNIIYVQLRPWKLKGIRMVMLELLGAILVFVLLVFIEHIAHMKP